MAGNQSTAAEYIALKGLLHDLPVYFVDRVHID